jgi:hypothetical protein
MIKRIRFFLSSSLIIYMVKCETPERESASPSGPRACSTRKSRIEERGNQIPIRDVSTLEADAHFLLLIQISAQILSRS